MNLFKRESSSPKELTEDIFLQTVANRICELKEYDPSDVGPIQAALSEIHSKQQKGGWGSRNKPEMSLIDALSERVSTLDAEGVERDEFSPDPTDILNTVLEAMTDSISTLRKTHHISDRSNVLELFERERSATYGQELSMFIGRAMHNPPRY